MTALRNMPQGVRSRGKVDGKEASMTGSGLFASAGGATESSTAAGAALLVAGAVSGGAMGVSAG
jgi:hypothetical protein